MALTADRIGALHEIIIGQEKVPVAADAVIHLGALVSYGATGYCDNVADTAAQADKAIHFALEAVDNTGGSDGDKTILVMTRGTALVATDVIVQADLGKVAHATDENTLALTSTNGRAVGAIKRVGSTLTAVEIG